MHQHLLWLITTILWLLLIGCAPPGDEQPTGQPPSPALGCASDADCQASPQPCLVGRCLPSPTPTGGTQSTCAYTEPAANGTPCDDGDACSSGDVCGGGACKGKPLAVDDKNPCTVDSCDPATGKAVHAPTTGAPCDDGNACTTGDRCDAGVCKGKPRPVDDANPCTIDSCDPSKGVSHAAAKDGTTCDDGNACTGDGKCRHGRCFGAKPLAIDDKNPCTIDSCDPKRGIAHKARPAGVKCDDGDSCTTGDRCTDDAECRGKPVQVNDGNACTADSCDPAKGVVHKPLSGTPCGPLDACHKAGVCLKGACTGGGLVDVDDGNACTVDSCSKKTGVTHKPVADGPRPCDDNACTTGDACVGGVCKPGPSQDDGNPCTIEVCDPAVGTVTVEMAPQGATCGDASACAGSSVCDGAGHCVAGEPIGVDDGNPCTIDSCDPVTGPLHVAAAAGTACDDGDGCTRADQCDGAGRCVGPREASAACGFSRPDAPAYPATSDKPLLPPSNTPNVGHLAGALEALPTGDISYSVGLAAVHGRGEVTPTLGLAYSSGRGNGVVGVGFSLTGTSSITRCPKSFALDGVVKAVAYDESDALCLDGQRIVCAGGSPHIDGATCATRPESFSTIVAHTDPSGQLTGPVAFDVYTKAGQHLRYGRDDAGDEALALTPTGRARSWSLRSVRDRNDNVATYHYEAEGAGYTREQRLRSIEYPPGLEIRFEHEDRPDVIEAYSAGQRLTVSKRLSRVTMLRAGNEVRRYELRYDESPHASQRSRLVQLAECAADACKKPTNLRWGGNDAGYYRGTTLDAPASKLSTLVVADFNGDGRDDVAYDQLVNGADGADTTHVMVNGAKLGFASPLVGPQKLAYGPPYWQGTPVDFDLDGRTDLLFYGPPLPGATYGDGIESVFWVAKGPSFGEVVPTTITYPWRHIGTPDLLGQSIFADLTGDGLADLVQCRVATDTLVTTWTLRRYVGEEKAFDATESTLSALAGHPCTAPYLVLDVDGDGISELLLTPAGATGPESFRAFSWSNGDPKVFDAGLPVLHSGYQGRYVALDVNGDGLRDVVTHEPASLAAAGLRTYVNTGAGFVLAATSVVTPGFVTYPSHLLLANVIDYDGDGIDDLLLPSPDLAMFRVLRSTPGGFEVIEDIVSDNGEMGPLPFDCTAPPSGVLDISIRYQCGRTLDHDGDGKAELLMMSASTGKVLELYPRGTPGERLIEVDEGSRSRDPGDPLFVPTYRVDYQPLVDNYQDYLEPKVCPFPQRCNVPHRTVVSAYAVANGNASALPSQRSDTTLITYGYHRSEWPGAGDLGFGYRKLETRPSEFVAPEFLSPSTLTVVVEELFHNGPTFSLEEGQRFPFAGRLAERRVSTRAGPYWERALEQNDWKVVAGDVSHFVAPSRMTVKSWRGEMSGPPPEAASLDVARVIDLEHDGDGNVVSRIESSPAGKLTETVVFETPTIERRALPLSRELCDEPASGGKVCVRTETDWDAKGRLAEVRRLPSSPELRMFTTFVRDEHGNVVGVISQDGKGKSRASWTYYDPDGWYPYAQTNAEGHTASWLVDPSFGAPLLAIDANGLVTRWSLDWFGRALRQVDADDTETLHELSNEQLVGENVTRSRVITTLGPDTTTYADSMGRPVKQTFVGALDGQSYASLSSYEASLGVIAKRTVPRLEVLADGAPSTTLQRDPAGDDAKVIDPDGVERSVRREPRAVESKDAKGNTRRVLLDHRGHVARVIEPGGKQTDITRGAFGRALSIKQPSGHVATYEHNDLGWITREIDPDRGERRFTYDAFGQVTHIDGVETVSFSYDGLGRLIERVDADGTTTWQYDAAQHGIGKLWKVTGPDGLSEQRSYDALGRLDRIDADSPIGGVLTTRFTHQGHLVTRVDYPHTEGEPAFSVRHEHDARGNLIAVRDDGDGSLLWSIAGLDEAGRVNREQLGDGPQAVLAEVERDPATGLLKRQRAWKGDDEPLFDVSYDHDANRNVRLRHDALVGHEEVFTYDQLDRLTGVSLDGAPSLVVAYDAAGNIKDRRKASEPASTWTYSATKPHAVEGTPWGKYAYDARGNQTIRPDGTVTYGALDLPVEIKRNGATTVVHHDAHGQRSLKVGPSGTTLYAGGLYERHERPDGAIEGRFFVASPGRVVAVVSYEKAKASAAPVWHRRVLVADHLGSTAVLVDEAGNVERRSHDAFGQRRDPLDWSKPLGAGPQSLPTLGYTGHEDDLDEGLVNMQGRVYDPRLGRFLTPDPFVTNPLSGQGWNRYAYALDNPLTWVDPAGYDAEHVSASDLTPPGATPDFPPVGQTWVGFVPALQLEALGEATPWGNGVDLSGPAPGSSAGVPQLTLPLHITQSAPQYLANRPLQTQPLGNTSTLAQGDRYNPFDTGARAGTSLFGAPHVVEVDTPEEKQLKALLGFGAYAALQFVPGVATLEAVLDPKATKVDVAIAVTLDAVSLVGVGMAVKGGKVAAGAERLVAAAARGSKGGRAGREAAALRKARSGVPDIVYRAPQPGPYTGPPNPHAARTPGEHVWGAEHLPGSPFESWTSDLGVAEGFAASRGTSVQSLDLRTISPSRLAADLRTPQGRAAAAAREQTTALKNVLIHNLDNEVILLRW